ncbi:hypothetical protein KX816_17175 [Sphingosinicellaceae bacterium]|nr:hypothetical protein KX816_17175 [Sphingosinicellaceae bacterium]
MEVLIIFETAYSASPSDAVWIVDTDHNRAWFEACASSIGQNSAVFNLGSDPVDMLWTVFEHHPAWTSIVVTGVKLTPEIASGVASKAVIKAEGMDGFSLIRAD